MAGRRIGVPAPRNIRRVRSRRGETLAGSSGRSTMPRWPTGVAERAATGIRAGRWRIAERADALGRPALAISTRRRACRSSASAACRRSRGRSRSARCCCWRATSRARAARRRRASDEVILADAPLDPLTLVEDELLLALPFAPRCERRNARRKAPVPNAAAPVRAEATTRMQICDDRTHDHRRMSWLSSRTRSRRRSAACTARTTSSRPRRSRVEPVTRRGASAPPHQPERLLPRQEGRQDQGRRVDRSAGEPPSAARRRALGTPRCLTHAVTVAVDAMGGDHGPSVTLPAALAFLEGARRARDPGRPRGAAARACSRSCARPRAIALTIHAASEVVEMDEPPADALRKKKDSSMRVAINLVKDGAAQACVSAGNTGALMAIARFVLKTLPGIDRPAIASQLPTRKGVDHGARPRRQRQLHARAAAAVRGDGQRAGDGGRRHRAADGRPAQHRRGGRSRATSVVKQAAELLQGVGAQLLRQRRRRRHLQGHDRRRRLRRLRRQRRAEDVRGPGADALRVPEGTSSRATR